MSNIRNDDDKHKSKYERGAGEEYICKYMRVPVNNSQTQGETRNRYFVSREPIDDKKSEESRERTR